MPDDFWVEELDPTQLERAFEYLSLIMPQELAQFYVASFAQVPTIYRSANDILRAAQVLEPLDMRSSSHAAMRNEGNLPVLIIPSTTAGQPLIIAEGYDRISSCARTDHARVPCKAPIITGPPQPAQPPAPSGLVIARANPNLKEI
jgi:hypothetical protein